MTTPKAASKNRWGDRVYPIPRPGDGPDTPPPALPSVSSILKALPAPGLETWKQKVVAYHVATSPDLAALAASATGVKGDGSQPAYAAVKGALERERTAANLGTAAHSFTEKVDAGTYDETTAPAAVRSLMDRYSSLIDRFGIEIVATELTVFNHEVGYAGTADRIVRIPGLGTLIADYKTGAEMYGDVALQLAAYANAEGGWDGEHHLDLPKDLRRDLGVVIHCPAHDDRAELLIVELTAAWPTFRALTVVRGWQEEGSKVAIKGPHTVAGEDETVTFRNAWLRRRLAAIHETNATAFQVIAEEWPEGVATPKARDLTHVELDQVAAVLRDVEARFQLPFGESDPAGVKVPPAPAMATPDQVGVLRQAVAALPRDLLAGMETAAAEAGVGPLTPTGTTMETLELIGRLVADATVTAQGRESVASAVIEDLDGQTATALMQHLQQEADGALWGEVDLERLCRLVNAIAAGVVVIGGWEVLVAPDAEDRLVAAHGGKRQLLATARETAASVGFDKPASTAEIFRHPLLVAACALAPVPA